MKNRSKYIIILMLILIVEAGYLILSYGVSFSPGVNSPIDVNIYKKNISVPKSISTEIVCGKSDPLYCESDHDCICAGEGGRYPGCFSGNMAYYEKCEDKKASCTDYCQGWGRPNIKCVNNKCSPQ